MPPPPPAFAPPSPAPARTSAPASPAASPDSASVLIPPDLGRALLLDAPKAAVPSARASGSSKPSTSLSPTARAVSSSSSAAARNASTKSLLPTLPGVGTHASYAYLRDDKDLVRDNLNVPIWRHPLLARYRRTAAAALGLFVVGTVFLILMATTVTSDASRALVFGLIALFTFLPGAYVSLYMYRAIRGVDGYRLETIPSFDH
ncbi:hypothetical protein GGF32_009538 [Allomyces javanicus]|nr:hypothetical protein GGF32_009538 [Allomyces javanicus]